MITKEELLKNPSQLYLKLLLSGTFGVGKTYTAMTCPRWAYAMIEPNGMTTALVPANQHLLANMVYFENFVPSAAEEIKETFSRLSKFLVRVREDMKAGKVDTLILDNLTHLAENRWMYMDVMERGMYTTSNGAVNTLQMYGGLGRWLYKFILTEVISLPGNVVVNCHLMDEEESVPGKAEQRQKTGRIISNVLGGFRKDAPGLFNASLYLEKKLLGEKAVYQAVCQQTGMYPFAKNNIGLPPKVENISYQTLMGALGSPRGGSSEGGTV